MGTIVRFRRLAARTGYVPVPKYVRASAPWGSLIWHIAIAKDYQDVAADDIARDAMDHPDVVDARPGSVDPRDARFNQPRIITVREGRDARFGHAGRRRGSVAAAKACATTIHPAIPRLDARGLGGGQPVGVKPRLKGGIVGKLLNRGRIGGGADPSDDVARPRQRHQVADSAVHAIIIDKHRHNAVRGQGVRREDATGAIVGKGRDQFSAASALGWRKVAGVGGLQLGLDQRQVGLDVGAVAGRGRSGIGVGWRCRNGNEGRRQRQRIQHESKEFVHGELVGAEGEGSSAALRNDLYGDMVRG